MNNTVTATPPRQPADDSLRVKALESYRILDTPQEREFDDIVWLAAQICHTPISLVSLVDRDRQWFKGRYGLAIQETPRRLSFCSHTIRQAPQIMEVPDATADARFADNALVTGAPDIRFYAGAPLVTPDGHALGTLCVIDNKPRHLTDFQKSALQILSRHVMAQMELKRQLVESSRTSKDLATANAELEGFAQAMSHDMRSPLRAILSYVQLLLTCHATQVPPEGKELLQRIDHSAHRMSGLIDDLLRLLRVKEQRVESQTVEMNSLISEVVSEIRREHPEFRGRLVLGNLPEVSGDGGLLSLVWMNLILNAFKFSQAVADPVIEIGARQGAERITYFVKDNGVGFDMQKSSNLWKPFSRLHGREVDGTGLGLSIVKSIVERHGGEVEAQGAAGLGATFSFSLPAGRTRCQ